jgi:hypothetical protein
MASSPGLARTRRWRVTDKGHAVLASMLRGHAAEHPGTLLAMVAQGCFKKG